MRYFIGFLVTIGLIILLIFLLFHGGGKPKVPATSKTLDSYAGTSAITRMTIDGPVNANSIHERIRVSVSQDEVTYEEIHGYEDDAVVQQHYPNTQSAYATFLLSLSRANFTQGKSDADLKDERGHCALGDRYIFELVQDGKTIERYWATNCGGVKTYLGGLDQTLSLFKAQVPNYNDLTSSIDL